MTVATLVDIRYRVSLRNTTVEEWYRSLGIIALHLIGARYVRTDNPAGSSDTIWKNLYRITRGASFADENPPNILHSVLTFVTNSKYPII